MPRGATARYVFFLILLLFFLRVIAVLLLYLLLLLLLLCHSRPARASSRCVIVVILVIVRYARRCAARLRRACTSRGIVFLLQSLNDPPIHKRYLAVRHEEWASEQRVRLLEERTAAPAAASNSYLAASECNNNGLLGIAWLHDEKHVRQHLNSARTHRRTSGLQTCARI